MLDLSPEEFSKKVEDKVETMGDGYIGAILSLCDEYSVEPEFASKLLSKSIVEKLHDEGLDLNMIPKTSQLPV